MGEVQATNIAGSGYSGTTLNGYLKFDVTANATLVSVEVSTDQAGVRIIELRDNLGVMINSSSINIPVGTSVVNLGFALTPGTNYQLGTNTTQNNITLGTNSPRLVRDNTSATFPYTLPGTINISTGNNGSTDVNQYFYFYNWVVDITPTDVCVSSRTPATIFVTAGAGISEQEALHLNVYPNPTSDFVNIEFTTPEAGEAMLSIFDMLGKKVYDVNLGMTNGTVIKTLSTATYAKGIYNVQLTVNNKAYNTKVVVK
jgi:hypothetical protein